MAVIAFEGPAGSGKTYRLLEELVAILEEQPLADHQRVAALTFMHGSRRRLDERLRAVAPLAGRYEATTLDSFAWRIVQRWQRLALHLGHTIPVEEQYTQTCALAAALLEREDVRAWVAGSFPIVLVDEAQDLSAERSAIIAALAQRTNVLLAFDEFQCLSPDLLPIAIGNWLPVHCQPTVLEGCRRTNDDELIAAARAMRNGDAVNRDGRRFRVILTLGAAHGMAATRLASTIRYRGGGNVAVLTPSRQGGFANGAVARVCEGPVGQRRHGPFKIEWETGEEHDAGALWDRLELRSRCAIGDVLASMAEHRHEPEIKMVRGWLLRQRGSRGLAHIEAGELRRQLDRAFAMRRRYSQRRQPQFAAMTIQQAKNREFDHVVVLWPFRIPADDEQRRRLLYNAITRAVRSCTVLVQGQVLLDAPPFLPRAENA